MTDLNNHPLADNQNEELIKSLRNEISTLTSHLKKKDERIATLERKSTAFGPQTTDGPRSQVSGQKQVTRYRY